MVKKKNPTRIYVRDPKTKREIKVLAAELDKSMADTTDFLIAEGLKGVKKEKKERLKFDLGF